MMNATIRRFNRTSSGFTIIELLVVVGILAMLMTILLPTLDASRRHARLTLCAGRLHHLHTAYALKTTDSDRGRANLEAFGWSGLFSRLLDSDEVLKCPEHVSSAGTFSGSFVVSDLVLKAYSGSTYKHDIELFEGQYTVRVDKNTPSSVLAKIGRHDGSGSPTGPAYGADGSAPWENSPIPDNTFYFYFEDLRPPSGIDWDYRDVVLRFEELQNGQIQVTYVQDHAGYVFDLVAPNGTIIWNDMNAGGSTNIGTGTPFEVALSSYGMNSKVNYFRETNRDPILILDYAQSIANIDEALPDDWSLWPTINPNVPHFARHPNGTVNVLYLSGAVDNTQIPSIDPGVGTNLTKWQP